MKIVLYRSRLSLTSGAGQLIRMQQEGLRAAGQDAVAACRRGASRFLLRTRLPVRRLSLRSLETLAASPSHLVVDHQMAVPSADLVFVHNLMTEAIGFLERDDWRKTAGLEARFFQVLRPDVPIVANSQLVRRALLRHFPLDPVRVLVRYPGFRSTGFRLPEGGVGAAANAADAGRSSKRDSPRQTARNAGRAALGIAATAPLIGFVTSGEFDKRGLDIFLDAAGRVAALRPETRFLIVGARRLPDSASRHPLARGGRLLHRPKSSKPERWFAALDIFLYPARFEEFGMVVSEAQASGLPVLTSRRVGAAECLPKLYAPWILDAPDAAAFAAKVLALLDDEGARLQLSAAGLANIAGFDQDHYVKATVDMILSCARRKASGAGKEAPHEL
jgi:glycosyltransferase involved in cell wall biosynthesis